MKPVELNKNPGNEPKPGGLGVEFIPPADDPMIQKPGPIKDMVDSARQDYESISPEDIDAAFARAEETFKPTGEIVKRMPQEALHAVSIGQEAMEVSIGDVARDRARLEKETAEARRIEEDFLQRFGVELGRDAKGTFAGIKRRWSLRNLTAEDRAAIERHEATKSSIKTLTREIRYQELAAKDTTTRGALSQLSRSLRKMEHEFYGAYGVTIYRDETPAELHKRFKKVATHDPHALATLRTYLEAREQLSRMEKAAGIDQE